MGSDPEIPTDAPAPIPSPPDAHAEDLLDEALEATFPASDPISLMSHRGG